VGIKVPQINFFILPGKDPGFKLGLKFLGLKRKVFGEIPFFGGGFQRRVLIRDYWGNSWG